METPFGMNFIPENDQQRIAALRRYQIVDTPPEHAFDHIAKLATKIFDVPIALISLVDADKEFFKANIGMPGVTTAPRGTSLCALAVLKTEPTVFTDTLAEPALSDNPLVIGEFGLKFYAGAPLITHDGFAIGTLCIIDKKTRTFNDSQLDILKDLAKIVMNEIELRLSNIEEFSKQQSVNDELYANNEELVASNEEMLTSNEELMEAQENLRKKVVELAESEARFRNMIEQSPVAMLVTKGEELILEEVNQPLLELIGKDKSVKGKPWYEAIPEMKGQPIMERLHHTYRTSEEWTGYEQPITLTRDGKITQGYYNVNYKPLLENGLVIGVIQSAVDVTEQVEVRHHLELIIAEKTILENSLRENEQRLQSILDTMAEGVCIIDVDGMLVYANPMAQKILGFKQSVTKRRAFDDPRWENLRVDGSPLPEADHPMTVMMKTGMAVYDQEIAVQPPGKERFYISINAAPIIDHDGNVTGGVGTFMDVTIRRKSIQQKDDFIGIASHELKTPVTSLKSSLQLLDRIKDNPPPDMLAKLITQSGKSLDKLSGLINDLLNVNRITNGQLHLRKTTFSITELINGCCQHVRAGGTHDIILKGDKKLLIYADEQRIDQVVVNFVNNSVKYAPDSRDININIEKIEDTVKISVKDKGMGIPAEKLPHLFDRYYRADHSGVQFSGLGLGLYICAEIIRRHNGQIGVESELGKGSTFWFTLPLQKPDAKAA